MALHVLERVKAAAEKLEIIRFDMSVLAEKTQKALIDHPDRLHATLYVDDKSGKMFGTGELGTTCVVNETCLNRIDQDFGVCRFCFGANVGDYKEDLAYRANNYDLLQRILTAGQIADIASTLARAAMTGHKHAGVYYPPSMQVRIESKGDTGSSLHACNYYRIAAAIKAINPEISVTAWTKNIDHYAAGRMLARSFDVEDPDNVLRVGYSAFYMNEAGVEEVKREKAMHDWLAFGFVVYRRDDEEDKIRKRTDEENVAYVADHFSDDLWHVVSCTCEFASCAHCGKCYGRSAAGNGFIIVLEHVRG